MMRKTILALALLMVPGTAMAQGGGRAGGMGGQAVMAQQNAFQLLLEKKAEYNLSDAQLAKVDIIAKALAKKHEPLLKELQTLMQGGGIRNMTPEQRQALNTRRQAMQADVDKEVVKLKEILTAEQHQKLTEELAALRQRRRPPPAG